MSYVGLGTSDPVDQTTVQLAEGIALQADPTKGRKYRFYKGAVQYASQQTARALAAFQKTQAGKAVYAAGGVADIAAEVYKQAQSGNFKADASGVIAVAGASDKFVRATTNFLRQIPGVSSSVLQEVDDWVGVGATCAAGIAAGSAAPGAGTAVGIAACGLIALGKLFSYVDVGPEYVAPWSQPRTVFQPNEVSVKYIMADALRLSMVLRAYYGVSAFAQLASRLDGPATFQWVSRNYYPSAPAVNQQGQIVAAENVPLPGHNLRTALQLFSFNQAATAAHSNTRDGLAVLAAWRHGQSGFKPAAALDPAGRGLYHRFEDDHDISQDVIANGAYFGRSAAAAQQHTRVRATLSQCGDLLGWPSLSFSGSTVRVVDFAPFVVVDELINFFAAVTARELDEARRARLPDGRRGDAAIIHDYGFGERNPTRHLYVRSHDRGGQPPDEGGSGNGYEQHCWSNLRKLPANCRELDDALYGSWQPRDVYLREAGAIRLMAALSFLHQQWAWSSGIAAAQVDPITQITSLGFVDAYGPVNAEAQMREPLDPRQVVGGRLTTIEQPTLRTQFPLQRSAATLTALTSAGLVGAPNFADPYAKAKTDVAYLVQQVITKEQWLRAAAAIAAGKTTIVGPTLTTLAPGVQATPQGWSLTPSPMVAAVIQHAAARKKSSTGPLLLGAAALLALKFLK